MQKSSAHKFKSLERTNAKVQCKQMQKSSAFKCKSVVHTMQKSSAHKCKSLMHAYASV